MTVGRLNSKIAVQLCLKTMTSIRKARVKQAKIFMGKKVNHYNRWRDPFKRFGVQSFNAETVRDSVRRGSAIEYEKIRMLFEDERKIANKVIKLTELDPEGEVYITRAEYRTLKREYHG